MTTMNTTPVNSNSTSWPAPVMTPLCDIDRVANHLWDFANAFDLTGNSEMAERLRLLSADIREATKAVRDAIANRIGDEFKQAQENSMTVLRAALAGAEAAQSV